MILKFVYYPSLGGKSVEEELIDCGAFSQSYHGDDTSRAHFAIHGPLEKKGCGERTVDCEHTAVYVMSDTGKTIDSYKWRNIDGEIKRM